MNFIKILRAKYNVSAEKYCGQKLFFLQQFRKVSIHPNYTNPFYSIA
jgi:hypothetical protein